MRDMGDMRMERQDERINKEAERRMEGENVGMEEKDEREDGWEEVEMPEVIEVESESEEKRDSGMETPIIDSNMEELARDQKVQEPQRPA